MKKNPRGEPGAEGHHHEHLSQEWRAEGEPILTTSRGGNVFALFYLEYSMAFHCHLRTSVVSEDPYQWRIEKNDRGSLSMSLSAVFVSYEHFCL